MTYWWHFQRVKSSFLIAWHLQFCKTLFKTKYMYLCNTFYTTYDSKESLMTWWIKGNCSLIWPNQPTPLKNTRQDLCLTKQQGHLFLACESCELSIVICINCLSHIMNIASYSTYIPNVLCDLFTSYPVALRPLLASIFILRDAYFYLFIWLLY